MGTRVPHKVNMCVFDFCIGCFGLTFGGVAKLENVLCVSEPGAEQVYWIQEVLVLPSCKRPWCFIMALRATVNFAQDNGCTRERDIFGANHLFSFFRALKERVMQRVGFAPVSQY